jgi:hypothetical protein
MLNPVVQDALDEATFDRECSLSNSSWIGGGKPTPHPQPKDSPSHRAGLTGAPSIRTLVRGVDSGSRARKCVGR